MVAISSTSAIGDRRLGVDPKVEDIFEQSGGELSVLVCSTPESMRSPGSSGTLLSGSLGRVVVLQTLAECTNEGRLVATGYVDVGRGKSSNSRSGWARCD